MARILAIMLAVGLSLSPVSKASDARKDKDKDVGAGLVPLTTEGFYERDGKKYERGLYPGGKNEMPAEHRAVGEKLAAAITPDRSGFLIAGVIGHSNPRDYFRGFTEHLKEKAAAGEVNPKLHLQSHCQGGVMSGEWAKTARDKKLPLSPDTQVLFLLTSIHNATPKATKAKSPEVLEMNFEQRTAALKKDMKDILQAAAEHCPNLKIAYLGCDTWRGYSGLEPHVYEEAFAVKSLIEDQIKGDPELAFTGDKRKVPWLAWGGYIWEPNAPRERFVKDGVHASPEGIKFVVGRWHELLAKDSTSRGWYLGK
jgi:hypothetical protein